MVKLAELGTGSGRPGCNQRRQLRPVSRGLRGASLVVDGPGYCGGEAVPAALPAVWET
jgi:hypothetical protein